MQGKNTTLAEEQQTSRKEYFRLLLPVKLASALMSYGRVDVLYKDIRLRIGKGEPNFTLYVHNPGVWAVS